MGKVENVQEVIRASYFDEVCEINGSTSFGDGKIMCFLGDN